VEQKKAPQPKLEALVVAVVFARSAIAWTASPGVPTDGSMSVG
jgi:hypothetical protein